MATNDDSSWEVIDGLQRITTLINFIRPNFKVGLADVAVKTLKLAELGKLKSLTGATYADLPETIRLGFVTRPIRITVLNDLSDFQVRFDLFERLNTGGIILHEQEIRNCVFQGRFNDFIKRCAEDVRLDDLIKRTDKRGRGNLEEFTLKFFAYFEERANFRHSVKDFLNEYMERKTKRFENESALRDVFDRTLSELMLALPQGIVRNERKNTTPLILAEAVFVGVADIVSAGNGVDPKKLATLLDDDELKRLTTGGTNSNPRLVSRIAKVRVEAVA